MNAGEIVFSKKAHIVLTTYFSEPEEIYKMKISLDKKADAMRIKFQEGEYEVSKEVEEGIISDLTKDNKIIAIEILDVSERILNKNLKNITVGIDN